jgi:hypothetical protein
MSYELVVMNEHNDLKNDIELLYNTAKINNEFKVMWKNCNALATHSHPLEISSLEKKILEILSDTTLTKYINNLHTNTHIAIWLNLYNKGCFQEPHDHLGRYSNSKFYVKKSFVYFFDVPKDESLFYFVNDDKEEYINEKSGDILFFDPKEVHGVDFNMSGDIRKTIAGNILIQND